MPRYKVLKDGFYGGIFRTPGGKHDPVVTAQPIPKNKMPSWLEEEKPLPAEKQRKQVGKPNEKAADFMGDKQEDDGSGLETL